MSDECRELTCFALRAAMEALADEWQTGHEDHLPGYSRGDLFADELRDVLAAEVAEVAEVSNGVRVSAGKRCAVAHPHDPHYWYIARTPYMCGGREVETKVLTLTDFLLARIASDATNGRQLRHHEKWVIDSDVKPEIETFANPDRVLAECAAKRAIVELLDEADRPEVHADGWVAVRIAVGHLAAIYADHPDYRNEWRP